MNYTEESYVLNILTELQRAIRSPEFKQLIQETHENNKMLKQIIKVINTYLSRHHQENEDDFIRNIIANQVSNLMDINKLNRK